MFHVSDYPDDLANPLFLVVGRKSRLDKFADDVFARKKFLRETIVDDHDRRRVQLIALIEDPALPNWDAHRLEVIGRDDSHRGPGALALGQRMFLVVE